MSLDASRKSRSAHIGVVTREWNRFNALESEDPSTYDVVLLEQKLQRLTTKAEEFHEVHQTICAFGPEQINQDEEDTVADQFEEKVERTEALLRRLVALNLGQAQVTDLNRGLKTLADARGAHPETNFATSHKRLSDSFASLCDIVRKSTIHTDHPLRREISTLEARLVSLSGEERGPSPIFPISDSAPAPSRPRNVYLPKIQLPHFDGDIMKWATFWDQFEDTVDKQPDLSSTHKLTYLRDAIRDPETNKLLYRRATHPGLYDELVTVLKRRFDKRRIIHAKYCRTFLDQTPVKASREEINRFIDDLDDTISGLKTSGQYDIGSCLTSLSVSRFPKTLQVDWEMYTKDQRDVPPIEEFLEFLGKRSDALTGSDCQEEDSKREARATEATTKRPAGSRPERTTQTPRRHRAAVHATTSSPSASNLFRYECVLCAPDRHQLYMCSKFNTMSIQSRVEHLKTHKLCFNCLAPGHKTSECRSTNRCRACSGKHHTMVHRDPSPGTTTAATVNSATSPNSSATPDSLLMTSQVLLQGTGGRKAVVRALLDTGATLSLISSRVAQNLKLPTNATHVTITGVSKLPAESTNTMVTLSLSPVQADQPSLQLNAVVVKDVTSDLPLQRGPDISKLPHLKDLKLADPHFHQPGRIDLLLGFNILDKIMKGEHKVGPEGTPSAWDTIFGWTITGPYQITDDQHAVVASSVHQSAVLNSSDKLLTRFWEIEELPSEAVALTPEEEEVEEHFAKTHVYLESSCRYQVTLPRKASLPPLGDSRQQALQRYRSNEKAVLRKGTWTAFQAVVQEYLDLGHAQLVPPDSLQSSAESFYLPMHSVYKECSTSTKLRVVFDASARSSTGISLNNTLLIGPTLHPNLDTILLRFRTYPVAITGDISKMYREVELSDQDRRLHRFLWRKHPSDPVGDYEMTRVTFGVAASPYLAVKALQQTASDHGHNHPRASCHVSSSFYVDDLLVGASSPEEALELQGSLRQLLAKGGFDLCKWRSSSPWVIEHIDPSLREKIPVKNMTDSHSSPHPKALGLQWDSEMDTMSTSLNLSTHFTPTKRGVIADIAKTFDVLGWISPSVIVMKILYQELWGEELDWDEKIPERYQTRYESWKKELPLLAAKCLPRCYYLVNVPHASAQLHGFSDASEKAYSAVVYLRSTYQNHSPIVSLVASKTKVAPLKALTIPRLELCGANLLARLITSVRTALDFPISAVTAWCDSTIVLAWLDGSPKRYRTFVGNRISSILKQVPPEAWLHVPTNHNPADCASRGMMPGELLNHELWWEGPAWLAVDPVQIPLQPSLASVDTPEVRGLTCTLCALVPSEWMEGRFESYPKTLAVLAWCSRFTSNLLALKNDQPSITSPHLSSDEIHRAEQFLFRQSQARSFAAELTQLAKGKCVSHNSVLLSLSPTLGQDGLLRVGGRLSHANLSLSQKHPIILSSKATVTAHLFKYGHVSLGHCGPTLLLASTGTRLHVIGARCLARSVCRSCVTCRRAAPRTETQMMGQLPQQRITPNPPFYITGVDYAGPFILKKGHTRKPVLVKSYIACFVCFSSKATHIEVVSDLTTETFLAALKRFIARRGRPKEIHSDNGTNFTGAKNDLNNLYQMLQSTTTESAIASYLLSERIQWHCIPERAPHFGGLWEAAVKATKRHLKRVVGSQRLTYEELVTVMCQIESCLNSRPLTAINSHSIDGITVLTPGHFLIGRALTSYPETVIKTDPSMCKRWNMCQAMVFHFWKRWSTEYLQQLQSLSKWKKASPNLQVGDIVVLKDDSLFLNHWPMARVLKTYQGADNLVRVVLLKTSTTTLRRPVHKLALLLRPEASPSAESDDAVASSAGEDVQALQAERRERTE